MKCDNTVGFLKYSKCRDITYVRKGCWGLLHFSFLSPRRIIIFLSTIYCNLPHFQQFPMLLIDIMDKLQPRASHIVSHVVAKFIVSDSSLLMHQLISSLVNFSNLN